MSGIFGLVKTGDLVDRFILEAMADALAHRGPDGYRLWLNGDVGFGHRMLQTTPEAHLETLPFYDPESQIAITSDSRLDNRDELISLVGRGNFKSEVIADSLIILESYKKWGCDCVYHLLGDFSFAIWEANEKRLFCARDHLGVKPFNYYHASNTFCFCSESRVIAHHSRLPTSIYYPRIADFLTPHLEGIDKISTFYTNIFRLPPGHFLQLSKGWFRIAKYWKPEEEIHETKIRSDEECIEQLTEILTTSVKNRVRGINAAILLSGGVDSATIMAIARTHYMVCKASTLATFSCIANQTANSIESRAILSLSIIENLDSNVYTPQNLHDHIEELFSILTKVQEPFDFHMVFLFFLYLQARREGYRVMLDGVDGDLLTSLPTHYPSVLFRSCQFKDAIYETFSQNSLYSGAYFSLLQIIIRYFSSAFIPQSIKNVSSVSKKLFKTLRYLQLSDIDKSFIKSTNLFARLMSFSHDLHQSQIPFPRYDYLLRFSHPFLTVALERYDRIASLLSIEPRHPFINKTIVDFFSSSHWTQFVRHGHTKYALRKVAENFLRKDLCWRTDKEHIGHLFTREFFLLRYNEVLAIHEVHHENLQNIFRQAHSLQDINCVRAARDQIELSKSLKDRTALLFWLLNNNL